MKYLKIMLAFLLIPALVLLVSCGGESVDKLKSYLYIAGQAYKSVITNTMNLFATTGDYEKLDKTCKAHMKFQAFWNIGIDGLQAYLENKDIGTEQIIVNLSSAKEVMQALFDELDVSPNAQLYVNVVISTVQSVVTLILPNVEISDGEQVDLTYLKIDVVCPPLPGVVTDKTSTITVTVAPFDDGQLFGALKTQTAKTAEMEALLKELEKK